MRLDILRIEVGEMAGRYTRTRTTVLAIMARWLEDGRKEGKEYKPKKEEKNRQEKGKRKGRFVGNVDEDGVKSQGGEGGTLLAASPACSLWSNTSCFRSFP